MPVSGGGFEQCDNAQAVVAEGSLLVVATSVVQAPNDMQQLEPMLALPEDLGKADVMLGDNGYFSAANVTACPWPGSHHRSLSERFAGPPPAPENPTPVEAMADRLRTRNAKAASRL